MIEFLIESFKKQDFFSFTGYLIGIAFGIWGIWSHYANKKYKKFSYTVHTFNLLNNKLKGVRGVNVTFNNVDIPNLSVTEITFWNSGTETIDGNDIAKNNKLKIIVSEGVEILETKILYSNNVSNGIVLTPDAAIDGLLFSKTIDIEFDYLDSQDGQTIQLYHTGKNSFDVAIVGAIKGVTKINRVPNNNEFVLEYVSDDSAIESFFKKNFITRISPAIVLFAATTPALFSDKSYSLIDITLMLLLLGLAIFNIDDYIKSKKKALPKWIKKRNLEDNVELSHLEV